LTLQPFATSSWEGLAAWKKGASRKGSAISALELIKQRFLTSRAKQIVQALKHAGEPFGTLYIKGNQTEANSNAKQRPRRQEIKLGAFIPQAMKLYGLHFMMADSITPH
jgi:hypothetical protein